MAAYRRVDNLQSPADWLPVHLGQNLNFPKYFSSCGNCQLIEQPDLTFLCNIPLSLELRRKFLHLLESLIKPFTLTYKLVTYPLGRLPLMIKNLTPDSFKPLRLRSGWTPTVIWQLASHPRLTDSVIKSFKCRTCKQSTLYSLLTTAIH